jgi:hypothetical protein
MNEATITVNRHELTEHQSLAIRIAIVAFLAQLNEPKFCAGLEHHAVRYHASLTQVMAIIDETPAEPVPPDDQLVTETVEFIGKLAGAGDGR